MSDERVLVLDVGSHTARAGLASAFAPPGVTQRSRVALLGVEGDVRRYAAGNALDPAAHSPEAVIAPVCGARVHDWDALEALSGHLLMHELGAARGTDLPLLYLEPWRTSKDERERLTQMLFEAFELQSVCIGDQAAMSAYGFNRATGLVVDIGHERTDVVPIVSWNVQQHLRRGLDVGGAHLDRHLLELLRGEQPFATTVPCEAQTEELAAAVRVAVGAVAPSAKAQQSGKAAAPEETFAWRGQSLTIGPARLACAEALFQPSLVDVESPGLIDVLQAVVSRVDPDKRRALLSHIMVTGSGSRMPGIGERIEGDLLRLPNMPKPDDKGVVAAVMTLPAHLNALSDRPDCAAWAGAAIASQMIFQSASAFVSRADYNETGPGVVHLKSFA